MKIIGTGSGLPKRVVTNDELSTMMDTSDEWISSRSGIRERRFMTDETLEDLAVEAANNALQNAGIDAKDLDFLICSNVANNYVTPGLGCLIQGRIGATCPSIDINCACAGFIFGLDMAESYAQLHKYKHVLVVCAEAPSQFCDWTKRDTTVLFADGAGAVVLEEGEGIMNTRLTTKSLPEVLYYKRPMEGTPFDKSNQGHEPLVMLGKDVFRNAVSVSESDFKAILEEANLTSDQVDYYLCHQANLRIIDLIREFLKQPVEKFPTNIDHTGNTSSASLPILMDELNRAGKFKNGDILALSAFGAGFVSGCCLIKWNK